MKIKLDRYLIVKKMDIHVKEFDLYNYECILLQHPIYTFVKKHTPLAMRLHISMAMSVWLFGAANLVSDDMFDYSISTMLSVQVIIAAVQIVFLFITIVGERRARKNSENYF